MSITLARGDRVMWRGGWGRDPAVETYVVRLEYTQGGRTGVEVEAATWWSVRQGRDYVADLGNGHWCYGHQLVAVGS